MTQLLLDTSSLMYRAYFALPRTITNKDGQPVNALHGYLDMCSQLIRDRKPKAIMHCFDHDWRPAPRVAAYKGYKATRAVDPEGLPEQFDVLQDLIETAGMARAEAKGWEAEDAIGSLCARAKNRDVVEIVTGDRDLIQCVRDPTVKVLFTRRGVSQLDLLDEAGVEAKYGVPPSRYADFAILRGDPSDELPGIKGVGEVMARALVRTYSSIEALQQDALAPKSQAGPLRSAAGLKMKIRDAAEYLAAMQDVVPIRTDLEVDLVQGKRDDERLDQLAELYALTGPVRRLREAFAGAGASPRPRGSRRRSEARPPGNRH
jgi:5'-3' exonuclease